MAFEFTVQFTKNKSLQRKTIIPLKHHGAPNVNCGSHSICLQHKRAFPGFIRSQNFLGVSTRTFPHVGSLIIRSVLTIRQLCGLTPLGYNVPCPGTRVFSYFSRQITILPRLDLITRHGSLHIFDQHACFFCFRTWRHCTTRLSSH